MSSAHHPAQYGERMAEVYDEWSAGPDPAGAVNFLADLAAGGRALELGVGTGRVALPLAARGIEVRGIDASEAMVARLRAKPGGKALAVSIGDFADVAVEGRYSVVFVTSNTLFALPSQDAQMRCFANVASRLDDRGVFVIEAFVPDLTRVEPGGNVSVHRRSEEEVTVSASRHDGVDQRVSSQLIRIRGSGVRLYPVQLRYAWPSELDLMARRAGLALRDRFADWYREPFTDDSPFHVSVYERA